MTKPTIDEMIAWLNYMLHGLYSHVPPDNEAFVYGTAIRDYILSSQANTLPMDDDEKRGSGRTGRMLEHAKYLAECGRAVYVIADTMSQVKELRRRLPEATSIKVGTEGSVGNLDWQQVRLRGAHPNCVVLIDHHAIEARFGKLMRMAHDYDNNKALRGAIAQTNEVEK